MAELLVELENDRRVRGAGGVSGSGSFESLFLGVECGYGRFEGSAMYSSSAYPDIGQCQSEATVKYLDWILDDDGNPQMSLALWGGGLCP